MRVVSTAAVVPLCSVLLGHDEMHPKQSRASKSTLLKLQSGSYLTVVAKPGPPKCPNLDPLVDPEDRSTLGIYTPRILLGDWELMDSIPKNADMGHRFGYFYRPVFLSIPLSCIHPSIYHLPAYLFIYVWSGSSEVQGVSSTLPSLC